MYPRQFKPVYFALEGLNSVATTLYFYYFYFYMQQSFGFSNKANLALAAAAGAVYAPCSIYAGRFAERHGYFNALKVGFGLLLVAVSAGLALSSAPALVASLLFAVVGMCFTWPTLEALVSHGETRAGLQNVVGIYNVVWAATAAVAYFLGGAMLENLGRQSLFFVPGSLHLVQLVLTFWVARKVKSGAIAPAPAPAAEAHPHPPAHTQRFLRMSWLANPFGYVAMNTMIAVIPGIAGRLGLSTMTAGFCCSIWFFARFASFVLLWRWVGWHYRARWLVAAYLSLVLAFVVILTVPNLGALVGAQLFFGLALGLMYYSSLFYSMDLSETKGEHSGIHEAAIGLGNFAGPAVGALSLQLLPQFPNSGAVAVSALLLAGLGGIGYVWRTGRS